MVDKGGRRREDGRKNNIDYVVYMPKNVRKALLGLYEIEKKKDEFDSSK